jgi:hypothetical protein
MSPLEPLLTDIEEIEDLLNVAAQKTGRIGGPLLLVVYRSVAHLRTRCGRGHGASSAVGRNGYSTGYRYLAVFLAG